MKDHKFQMIRIGVPQPGATVRFTGETDKSYARIRGIFVALPDPKIEYGATLSLKVGGQDVFDDDHDVRLITCGQGVAPNDKFFFFEEKLEAGGNAFEGRYHDPIVENLAYPYEVKVFLWLANQEG
ncbi:hypothetical protein [Croceimicrobium sp.]|uniref:hypothetical protein n=1 Tax=Croceimicrobium sp. TaxID=2828340 RepID=UPI003BADBC70